MTHRYCLCIPARNEVDRLPRLLEAIADQTVGGIVPTVLCINNSDDGSADVAARLADHHRSRIALTIDTVRFPPPEAHAGSARRRAMEHGLSLLGKAGDAMLLTTDADCRPPPGWIAANLATMAAGADIVGGRIAIDDAEPLEDDIASARARWDRYWDEVRAIEDDIDPRAWDGPPRHGDHTGASLAIRAGLYRAAGGVPAIPLGEDRALVDAAIAAGGRLAHPIDVWTRVSPRRDGRAAGGMADAMRRLHDDTQAGTPILVPAFDHWRRRAAWRKELRDEPDGDRRIAREEPALPPMPLDERLDAIV